MVKRMTVKDYAKVISKTPGAVTKAIRNSSSTPGLERWEKFNGDYILYVNEKKIKKLK